uniref:Uncharacterized protein n=1 Tax=Plectus sambesii TaxID=2011161 RepID=A0A914ULX7_9BILA
MRSASIAFVAVFIALVATQERRAEDDLTLYYTIMALSFVLTTTVAVFGYVKADWTVYACVLVALFGTVGPCFALLMSKCTATVPRT